MKQKIWNYILNNRVINILNLNVLLILIVPYSYSYSQSFESEKLHWFPNYTFQEVELLLFYIPLLILTIGFQVIKKTIWRNTLLILNLILCFLFLLAALFSLAFAIQDYMPGLGNLLSFTLFPLIIIIFKIEQYDQNKKTIANHV